jgi:hypothetical protein
LRQLGDMMAALIIGLSCASAAGADAIGGRPSQVVDAAAMKGSPGRTAAARPGGRPLPDDVGAFLVRSAQCATERPMSAAELWVAHERCMMLREEQARLLRRYARNREIRALIRSVDTSRY